ncbi:TPA: LexA family transcriptional regulator [Enterobacter cloacae]|nr:LexA family transcriptional regulator [Enterobacter cloacae]
MGFPSPAGDFVERAISLDRLLIQHPAATYFMKAGVTYLHAGIQNGALLIVDRSANACDGSIVVCGLGGELCLRRLRLHPVCYLESLDSARRREKLDDDDDAIWGVITHIINDARTGEFDDNPVM